MLGPEEGREDWEGRKEGGKPAERGSTAPVRSVPFSAVGVPRGGGGMRRGRVFRESQSDARTERLGDNPFLLRGGALYGGGEKAGVGKESDVPSDSCLRLAREFALRAGI